MKPNGPQYRWDYLCSYLSSPVYAEKLYFVGVMNMFGAIPGFIGTYISGAILEATGNWEYMYAVTGWVSVTGWAIFGYWFSSEPIT